MSGLTWDDYYPRTYHYKKDDKLEKLLKKIEEELKKSEQSEFALDSKEASP